jgi:hypothetical protein
MQASPNPRDPRAVLGAVKAQPGNAGAAASQAQRPALTAPARGAIDVLRGRDEGTALARTKELRDMRSKR